MNTRIEGATDVAVRAPGSSAPPTAPDRWMRDPERWEHGSAFELSAETGDAAYPWDEVPHTTWGSGRDAIRALLRLGRDRWGWRRILLPTYLCPVVAVAAREELEVSPYPCRPWQDPPVVLETGPTDVVMVVATFGLPAAVIVRGGARTIEDHTHDPAGPGAADTRADYAFASTRKTLPLTDGAILWSPRGRELPAEVPLTPGHAAASADRLEAMAMKAAYLAGGDVRKSEYLARLARSEGLFGHGDLSGPSDYTRGRLRSLPLARWRAQRAVNGAAFASALGHVPGLELRLTPFAAVLLFADEASRERVAGRLVEASVYPAIHWRLEGSGFDVPSADRVLVSRQLSIHTDQRYHADDLRRVAREVRRAMGRS